MSGELELVVLCRPCELKIRSFAAKTKSRAVQNSGRWNYQHLFWESMEFVNCTIIRLGKLKDGMQSLQNQSGKAETSGGMEKLSCHEAIIHHITQLGDLKIQ